MAYCTKCGATLGEGSAYCPSCGAPVAAQTGEAPISPPAPAANPADAPLAPNVAAMLAYFTFIPAILFLVLEPYNKDRFVRFHAFQSLFFNAAWIALYMGAAMLGLAIAFVPVVGWTILGLIHGTITLGGFVLWVIVVIKAYQNEKFQLPILGPLAEAQASRS